MTDTSTTQQAPPPRGRSALDDVFDRLHSLHLRRDTDRRWFGGVCSGIAARFDVDPLLIRAAAIALTIAGGLGLAVYLVLWFLLPDRYDRVLAERALRQGETWPVILGVVAALFVLGGLGSFVWGGSDWGGSLWLVLPVALVVWFVATRSRGPAAAAPWPGADRPGGPVPPPPPPGGSPVSAPTSAFAPGTTGSVPSAAQVAGSAPPPPPPGAARGPVPYGTPTPPYGGSAPPAPPVPPRPVGPPPPPAPRRRRPSGFVGLVSLGLVIGLGGLGVALADPIGFPGHAAVLGLVLALAGVSAVVLGLGLSGRASGFSGFLVVVLGLATVLGAVGSHAPTTAGGVGDRTWTPSASSLPESYSLGAGDATLDLARLSPATLPDATTIDVEMGVGELDVVVPAGLVVQVDASTGVGAIRRESVTPDGSVTTEDVWSGTERDVTVTTGDGDTPDLVVRAQLGIGDITIQEQTR